MEKNITKKKPSSKKETVLKKVEKKALVVSTVINLVMGLAGLIVFFVTDMQALFLDGFFSLIAGLSTILAVIFSKISKKKNSSYPTGMYFLEPFYGVVKSILIFILLTVSIVESSISAINYFQHGIGNTINIPIVLPYTLVMLIMSFGLLIFNKKQNQKISNTSTMLTAETKSNFVDSLISCGICFLIFILLFVSKSSKLAFLHYTGDFFITLLLVAVSIKEPINLLILSIREISGATVKDKEIRKKVRKIISKAIKEEDLDNKFEVYKIGMHIRVVILLTEYIDQELLAKLKAESIKEIKETFDSATIEFVIRK